MVRLEPTFGRRQSLSPSSPPNTREMTGELPEVRKARERLERARQATDRAARRRFRSFEGAFDENKQAHERAMAEEFEAEEELRRLLQEGLATPPRAEAFHHSTDKSARPA